MRHPAIFRQPLPLVWYSQRAKSRDILSQHQCVAAVNSNFENNEVFRALLSRHASTREISSANLAQLVAETLLDYSCKLDEQEIKEDDILVPMAKALTGSSISFTLLVLANQNSSVTHIS